MDLKYYNYFDGFKKMCYVTVITTTTTTTTPEPSTPEPTIEPRTQSTEPIYLLK